MKRRLLKKSRRKWQQYSMFHFLVSPVGVQKKADAYRDINAKLLPINKKWTFSNDPLMFVSHDSHKYRVEKISNEKQFTSMLLKMKRRFKADKKTAKFTNSLSSYSFFRKTIKRTPYGMVWLFMASDLVANHLFVVKNHKLVPTKKAKENRAKDKAKSERSTSKKTAKHTKKTAA